MGRTTHVSMSGSSPTGSAICADVSTSSGGVFDVAGLRRQLEELESKQAPPPEVQETPRDVRQCLYTGCPPPLPLCGVGIIVAVYDDIDLNSGSVFIEKILPGGAADESGLVCALRACLSPS